MGKVSYVADYTVPKSVGAGRKLMHNHVEHTIDTPCGVNGFRSWTDTEVPVGFVKCPCGWSGLPHYADRGYVKVIRGKRASGSW